MSDSECMPQTSSKDAERFAKLEQRIAALEKLVADTDFKMRNLKREIATAARSFTRSGTSDH